MSEVQLRASEEDVNWLRVVPAWIATNEGGATPEILNKILIIYQPRTI